MALSLIGTPQSGNASNGGDVTLTFDGIPAEGDLVLVFGGNAAGSGAAEPLGPSTAGYTEESTSYESVGPWHVGVWWKLMGATPDTTVVCQGSGSGVDATAYGSYVLRGADQTTPIDAATLYETLGTDTQADPPQITTATDGAWVFAWAPYSGATSVSSFSSGYGNTIDPHGTDTNRVSVGVAQTEVATAGAENPGVITFGGTADNQGATTAIRPLSGGAIGGGYMDFETDSVNSVIYTSDKAALDLSGSWEIIAKINPYSIDGTTPDWTPTSDYTILEKGNTNNLNYSLALLGNGTMNARLDFATVTSNHISTSAVPFSDGDEGWVRVTYDSTTGDITFYTGGTGDTPSWTQLGSTVSGTSGGTDTNTELLRIGRRTTQYLKYVGRIYYVEVKNGIGGTTVALTDMRNKDQGDWADMEDGGVGTAVADGYGNDWYVENYTDMSFVFSTPDYFYPTSDISVGHWDTAPTASQSLFAQVDEVTPSDTDYIYTVP